MNIATILAAALISVALYRLGRREGERGCTSQIFRPRQKPKKSALLEQIENYQGGKR